MLCATPPSYSVLGLELRASSMVDMNSTELQPQPLYVHFKQIITSVIKAPSSDSENKFSQGPNSIGKIAISPPGTPLIFLSKLIIGYSPSPSNFNFERRYLHHIPNDKIGDSKQSFQETNRMEAWMSDQTTAWGFIWTGIHTSPSVLSIDSPHTSPPTSPVKVLSGRDFPQMLFVCASPVLTGSSCEMILQGSQAEPQECSTGWQLQKMVSSGKLQSWTQCFPLSSHLKQTGCCPKNYAFFPARWGGGSSQNTPLETKT